MPLKCSGCDNPQWGVKSIAYPHHPGIIMHWCRYGEVTVSLNDLQGEELAEAQRLVGGAAAVSKANAAAYRRRLNEE